MGEWMALHAFGWLRRPELDQGPLVMWESLPGQLVFVVRGRRYVGRRLEGGLEIATEDYARQNG